MENRREAILLVERLAALDAEATKLLLSAKPGNFANVSEASTLADLLQFWSGYNRDRDGLANVKRALLRV